MQSARPSVSPPPIELELAIDDHCVISAGNVIFVFAYAEPSRQYLDCMLPVHRKLQAIYPRGSALIVVIDPEAKPPSQEAREELNQTLRSLAGVVVVGTHVVEGTGFRAAAKRSALSLVNLLTRLPFPMKVLGTLDEAVPWVLAELGDRVAPGLNSRYLIDAAAEARRKYAAKEYPRS